MPRTRKGRSSKVRTAARRRRRNIAVASLVAVALTLVLGGWAFARVLRGSRAPSVAAVAVKPATTLPLVIEAPRPAEVLPMPAMVEPTPVAVESAFMPFVPDDGTPRGILKQSPKGFATYALAKRIDYRAPDLLQAELAHASEVGLATPFNPTVGKDLATAAKRAENLKKRYPGSVVMTRNRPELAGLPFRVGRETRLFDGDAQNMNDMSRQFRQAVTESLNNAGKSSAAPDVDRLHALLKFHTFADPKPAENSTDPLVTPWRWNRPEAVPCIQQMLQAEGPELRRMSCALLREIDSDAATEALVKWAVFDTDAGNRAAAVEALRARDSKRVGALLSEWVRYPWPRAVEHACEALVELGLKEALPQLAAALAAADPDAPYEVDLPGTGGGVYKQEVVRVNHLRNCLMCHPASFKPTELVRGAVPDDSRILPAPTTPAYYTPADPNALQVTATTTYLKQDFSHVQTVANPGKWPAQQRFDYFVSTKQVEDGAAWKYVPNAKSPYKEAVRFAIRELAGPGRDWDSEWLADQRAKAPQRKDRRVLAAAQTYALRATPEAFIAFKMAEFQTPIYELNGAELVAMFEKFSITNPNVLKGTMIAYLEPLSEHPQAGEVKRIQRLLAIAKGPSEDLRELLQAVGHDR